jgi:hypothetical protein
MRSQRALDVLKKRQAPADPARQGRAYAQADADIRALVERTGIPYLPMSMAKGLLPDTHPQSASAARSYVLAEADVVVLIGARLNWLLSHGKGKTWGKAEAVRADRYLADRNGQQRRHRRAADRRYRLLRLGAAGWHRRRPASPSRHRLDRRHCRAQGPTRPRWPSCSAKNPRR